MGRNNRGKEKQKKSRIRRRKKEIERKEKKRQQFNLARWLAPSDVQSCQVNLINKLIRYYCVGSQGGSCGLSARRFHREYHGDDCDYDDEESTLQPAHGLIH